MKQIKTLNIGHFTQKGQIFGIDAMISFTIMLFCLLTFAITLANQTQNTLNNLQDFELEEKTIAITDSLVKNRDENNPLFGSCAVDYEKKRVLTSVIDIELLRKAQTVDFEGIFAKQITIKKNDYVENIFLETRDSNQCISVKRFALIENKKSILEVVICRS